MLQINVMNYIVAVIFNEHIFHLSLSDGKRAEISSSSSADIIIPNFGHSVFVTAENGVFYISDTAGKESPKTYTQRLNSHCVLDKIRHISLSFAEEKPCESIAWLGKRFSISLGRKHEGKEGRKNDIVLPTLSYVSQDHFEITRKNGKTIIRDLNSRNGTFVNGNQIQELELQRGDEISILTARIYYEVDYLRFENTGAEPELSYNLCWNPHSESVRTDLFKRSPRIQERLPGGKIEIPAPPAETSRPDINWLSTLLPAGVTIAIALTMAFAGSEMMLRYSLPMTVAGVIVSITNYLQGNKKYRRNSEDRRNAYLQQLKKIEAAIKEKREVQKKAMLLANPSPLECLAAVKSRSTTLWCREPDDTDFLSVRLGTGTVPFSVILCHPEEKLMEEDELRKKPGELYRAYNTIDRMPILCDIRSCGVVGLLGTPKTTRSQLQNMILHLTTHHCYTELKLVCFYSEDDQQELSWLADLPHTHGNSQDEIYLANTQDEAEVLFRQFTELFKQRKQEKQDNSSYGSDPLFSPYILFVFFEPKLLKKSDPINQYLFMEHGLSVGCLMAAQKIAQLPKQCTEIVTLSDDYSGEIYNTSCASIRQSFQADQVPSSLRHMFGVSMHPLYCDEGITVSSLPKKYSFYQMLGINQMSEYDIGKSWRNSDLLFSELAPSAPIGILENGEQIYFNSPETGENGGAHALVAGTNGSGKSEVLLTIILSLALRYPPKEVSFLVVDFKGDSLAGKLTGLPHLRGVITNLDGDELRRSLVSIKAETYKRMRLFQEYNETHPDDKQKISNIKGYMMKYHQGKVSEALPHLFIVVDEFAQLKHELPDIMNDFISTAQIGRALGVHLILATQSPSGVVDNKIRANLLKQLCLKVVNADESRDMIGSDLAAHIKDAGRGYLKIDDNLQLFQAAYGGGILHLPDGSESTQVREASDAIASYCHSHSIQQLPDIFCPPLPLQVDYPKYTSHDSSDRPFGLVTIGIRDDPAELYMGEYTLDISARNTLIVGSQMMGKTNLLLTIIRGVANLYSPLEVNIYILDFASLFLKNFETLPQVGGVVTLQETEKITNLFRLLQDQIELRRQKLLELGVSTFAAYRESGARDLPQIILLVDNLAAAKEFFPPDNDPLLNICKDGLSLGISVVATSAQAVGGMTYLPTFANRIALYNNDDSIYSTLLGRTDLRPKQVPGRCLVQYENAVYACQSYLAFYAKREVERAEEIRKFCQDQNTIANGMHALPIPFIPKVFTVNDAFATYPEAYDRGRVMLGLDYSTVKPLSIKLSALGVFAISGREKDVQNFQRYLISSGEMINGLQTRFYIIDSIERTLQPFSKASCVIGYSFLPEHATQMLLQVRKEAENRYVRVAEGEVSILDNSPTLVLMLNSDEAINAISGDKKALEAWNELTRKFKTMNICIIFGALSNMSIPFGNDVLKKIKDDRKLMFFEDLGNLKIGDLPYATTKKFSGALQKGDGYLIVGNEVARIRVPECPLLEDNSISSI